MKKRKVHFDYFQVFCEKEENDVIIEKKLDISGLLKKAMTLKPKETTYDFRGEKARIQKVEYDQKNKVWEIQFLRLREISPPGVAKEDGTFEIFHLEDGEYIGESVSALYDKNDCILVLQRNINSLPPSGIEEYLNKCFADLVVKLKPIISGSDISKITSDKIYRSIAIGVATKNSNLLDESSHLGKILKHFYKFEGTSIKVEVSVGNAKRDRSLSPGLVNDTVKMLYDNGDTTQLRVNTKDSPDTKVEKIDLLDDRRKDIVEFQISRDKPLTHEVVFPEIKSKYLERRIKETIF
jgi:hypothetical protein